MPRASAGVAAAGIGRALAWFGIALLALGTWLALPRAAAPRVPLDIVLVDVSKSVFAPRRSDWQRFVREQLTRLARESAEHRAGERSAAEEPADVCVVAFGSEVRTLVAPASANEVLARLGSDARSGFELLEHGDPAGSDETKLSAALDLAATLAADRNDAHVVILGDGTYTGRDPAPAADALQRAGATIVETLGLPAPSRSNVALGPLSVPRAIEVGAPLVVSLEALIQRGSDADEKAVVEIVRRDARGESKTRVALQWPTPSSPSATVPVHADLGAAVAGAIEIEARAVLSAGSGERISDAIVEDDVSSARVRCAGMLVVGVADADGSGAAVAKALQGIGAASTSGMQILPLHAGEIVSALSVVDALVTVDDALSADEARLLTSFVVHGGGWLDLAGWKWIARRAGSDDPLRSIAALVPAHDKLGPRDVILLVDASGSMDGTPFASATAAIGTALEAALPEDDVEVRFFADDLSPPIRLSAADRARPALRRAFVEQVGHARAPQGSTQLWRALEQIALERADSAREALVLLLSDGRDPDVKAAPARGQGLRTRLGTERAHIVVIAAGDDPDRDLLASLLNPGESIVDAGDLSKPGASDRLAHLFARALAQDEVLQGPFDVLPVAHENGIAADVARASVDLAPIARAVRADVVRTDTNYAEPFWSTHDGAPLGAIRRAGLGLSAALAFQPASDWAPQWTDPKRLAPLLRTLARVHALRSSEPRLREEDGRLCLENAPPDLPAPAHAHVVDGNGASADVLFAEAGPTGDPLLERCAPIPTELERSAGFWTVTFESASGPAWVIALATPRAPEFTFPPKRFRAHPLEATPRANVATAAPHPLYPWMLGAGALALFAAALLGAFSRRRA